MKCTFDPTVYANTPMGMFHCPECSEMVLAGVPHPNYDAMLDFANNDEVFEEVAIDNEQIVVAMPFELRNRLDQHCISMQAGRSDVICAAIEAWLGREV